MKASGNPSAEFDLERLEELARLELEPSQRDAVHRDIAAVLDFFSSLSELDTDGVEELVRPLPPGDALREDETRPSLAEPTVRELAVETQDGFFKVPRTVDGGH